MSAIRALNAAAILLMGTLAMASDTARDASKATPPPPAGAMAIVNGVAITTAQVEQTGAARLYEVRRQVIEELINQKLLENEAAARKLTVAGLLENEVDGKVAAITDDEVNRVYQNVKANAGNRPESQVKEQIRNSQRNQKLQIRRNEFLAELRAKANVRILIEPHRADVPLAGPSKGPADAPVTIVEFSDFQCPFCGRALASVKQLESRYGDRIRWFFRDFPLPMHAQAPKAAEAAACAGEQGKFWEMHDRLFANQGSLAVAQLKKHAVDLGLNAESFASCLDSGRHETDWKKGLEDGQKVGVKATPAFFINGRLISGARPYEEFVRTIDEELQRKGLPVPPPPATPKPPSPTGSPKPPEEK